jgi:peptidoglycan/LPS O-acetylase OafA/YrhL
LKRRVPELNLLRGIAVLLVIYVHVQYFSDWYSVVLPPFARRLIAHTAKHGWIGVDLFFVTSGYLISSLLFTAYERTGRIDFGNFFFRRGLKIWPAFWVLIAVTLIVDRFAHIPIQRGAVIDELLYLQNYRPGIWGHTWSLAVEEHFYIALPLLMILMLRFRRGMADPFRSIVAVFVVVSIIALAFRLYQLSGGVTPENHWKTREETHCRADGLMFGVLLCYFATYHNAGMKLFLSTARAWQVTLAFALVTIPLCFNILASYFSNTIGYTMIYVGCGLFIVQIQRWSSPLKTRLLSALNPISRIGVYSYSIYLWHQPVQHVMFWAVQRLSLSPGLSAVIGVAGYIFGSVALGAAMSKLVELPILRLREKWLPSPSGDLPDLSS